MKNQPLNTAQLPMDIIKLILSYDKRFVIRNGKIIQINSLKNIAETYYNITQIPRKQHWDMHELTFVFLPINQTKEYYISVINNELVISTTTINDTDTDTES